MIILGFNLRIRRRAERLRWSGMLVIGFWIKNHNYNIEVGGIEVGGIDKEYKSLNDVEIKM